ncbi:MAG: hypothetical protein C0404_00890 [Verrucomicrobia bacterium]|nr:hypothetical protein [Verrucomicrobiota bacterium]
MPKKIRVSAKVRTEVENRLRRIARAGSVFVDGELFKGIVHDPAVFTGDDYQVDETKFIPVKQTLFKLKRIEEGDHSAQVLRRIKVKDKDGVEKDVVAIVMPIDIHLKDVKSVHPISPAMQEAFDGRMGVEEQELRGVPILSVYAPIRDSFEDVVGIIEVFGSLAPDKWAVDTLKY